MKLFIAFAVLLGIVGLHAQTSPDMSQHNSGSALGTPLLPDPPNVFHVGGSVKPPVLVKMVDAKISKEAHEKKISGQVIVRMIVDESGMPQEVTVVRSLGYGLDEEAVKAARQYRFKPATRDGKPVKVVINIAVSFQTV